MRVQVIAFTRTAVSRFTVSRPDVLAATGRQRRGESEKIETRRDGRGTCWDVPGATESRRDNGRPLRTY